MSEAKKYQIKTVQHMIDCTNEDNIDNFLSDLKSLLTMIHAIQSFNDIIGEAKGIPENIREIKQDGFTWIDDGKHDATIVIGTKEKRFSDG